MKKVEVRVRIQRPVEDVDAANLDRPRPKLFEVGKGGPCVTSNAGAIAEGRGRLRRSEPPRTAPQPIATAMRRLAVGRRPTRVGRRVGAQCCVPGGTG